MVVFTASIQATDLKQFFEIKNYQIWNMAKFTTDFKIIDVNPTIYNGEGEELPAGLLIVRYTFSKDGTIQNTPLDTLTAFSSAHDMYGNEYWRINSSKEILDAVNRSIKYPKLNIIKAVGDIISRGGVYAFRTYIDFMDYDRHDTVTVKDDPSLRLRGTTTVKTGSDVDITAFYNTGYPFDLSSLTGNESATVTLEKLSGGATIEEKYTQQFKLNLKDEAHPLVAGVDTLSLHFEKPELGAYTLRFKSNWNAVKDRDLSISVQDTLRATVSLDKQAYNLATDKKARLNLAMDYGYPHISAVESDIIPTIRIYAAIKENEEKGDTLFCDSLKMANDSLQTKDLLYKGDWELDLTKIDQSKLNGTSSEKQLHVTIKFNGQQQYAAVLPVSILTNTTSITQVSTSEQEDDSVYSLNGMRINPKRKLPAGIYIRKGKKVIIN